MAGSPDPGLGALARLLGLRRRRMADGEATVELTIGPDHLNPYGVAHGAVVYALVDTAMGAALVSRLEPGERCATVEVKIQYLAPVAAGDLRAEARLVERTRRLGVLEARAYGDGDRLVAPATGTFYIQGG
jgi:acyl-CoA thioesterase